MWWNFVGRSHEEIAKAREDWETSSDRLRRHRGISRRPPSRARPAQRHHQAAPQPRAPLDVSRKASR